MIVSALMLLTLGQPAVAAVEVRGATDAEVAALLDVVRTAAERELGAEAKAKAIDVRVIKGVTKLRVVLIEAGQQNQVSLDLPQDEGAWTEPMVVGIRQLFGVVVDLKAQDPRASPARRGSAGPWVVLGSGAVLLGTGVGFGLSARTISDDLSAGRVPREDIPSRADSLDLRSTVANVCFGAAMITTVVAIIWWAHESS